MLQATSIGLYSGVFNGLATGIGSVTGGFVYTKYGPLVMYKCISILSLLSLAFYIFGEKMLFRKHVHPYTSLNVDQYMTDDRLSKGNEESEEN